MEKQEMTSLIKYKVRAFAKANVYKNGERTSYILNLMPGQLIPQHLHPGLQFYFLVIRGKGMFIIDEDNVEVTKGDIIHCLGTEKLGFTNTGNEPVDIYVTLCKLVE